MTRPTDKCRVSFLHDNARPYAAAASARALVQQFTWEISGYAPYNPDLASSDYHLFLHLKEFLAGQRLRCDQETKYVVAEPAAGFGSNLFGRTHIKGGPTI
jgi:hypothetical protein